MGNRETFIDPAIQRIEDLLVSKGFAKSQWNKMDGSWFYRWNKIDGWKKENVTLTFEVQNPRKCHTTLYMYIVGPKKTYTLDINIDSFAKNIGSEQMYEFPRIFKKVRAKKILERIIADLAKNLSWFDNYKTKQMCLEHMARQQTFAEPKGFALKPDSDTYLAIQEVLNAK